VSKLWKTVGEVTRDDVRVGQRPPIEGITRALTRYERVFANDFEMIANHGNITDMIHTCCRALSKYTDLSRAGYRAASSPEVRMALDWPYVVTPCGLFRTGIKG
jgi:hypothetical protein